MNPQDETTSILNSIIHLISLIDSGNPAASYLAFMNVRAVQQDNPQDFTAVLNLLRQARDVNQAIMSENSSELSAKPLD